MAETIYATPRALWAAARDRAKGAARRTGRPANELLRQFTYNRLLARVFADPGSQWVLKGGTALLARVEDARHSKDVDLLARIGSIDDAVVELGRVLSHAVGDHFTFEVAEVVRTLGGGEQPGVDGRTLRIVPLVGLKRLEPFQIDLVTGSLMTADPETLPVRPLVELPGLPTPAYRLYPTVDHIADKLCATESGYAGRASTRVRDLVDLIVIARTQRVQLAELRSAIAQERLHRELPARRTFHPPDSWATTYPKVASATRQCDGLDFSAAVEVASRFLDQALSAARHDATWNPVTVEWEPRT